MARGSFSEAAGAETEATYADRTQTGYFTSGISNAELPQDRYRKQPSILKANMVQYKEEAATMIAELEQGSALDERLQTLGEYVATATNGLDAADKSDLAKRGFLRSLGVGAGMNRDNAKKYLYWAIFSPSVFNYNASASKQ